jgi:LmbE family N-acetylglucosaminyl deacetylase
MPTTSAQQPAARRRWPLRRRAAETAAPTREDAIARGLAAPDLLAVSPHQDDEVLTLGAGILEAVAAGKDVAVLLVSRGDASIVRTKRLPKQLGFVPSPHHFSAMRDREFDGAVRAMGATPIIAPYEERLPDGGATPEAVAALVRAHIAPGTPAITVSAYDEHPDHKACGNGVRSLVAEGYLPSAAYFISPERLDLVPEGVTLTKVGEGTPVTEEHQRPYREQDLARNWWGIGRLSVPESFDFQLRHPEGYRHD